MNEVGSCVEYINILLYVHMAWCYGKRNKHSSGNLVEQLRKGYTCLLLSLLVITVFYIGKENNYDIHALKNTESTGRLLVLTVYID